MPPGISLHKVNQIESLNTATTDLILKGKDIDLQGGVIKQNGVPFTPGGGGTNTDFIFRPAGVAAGNVYTDLALLLTAANAVDGKKRIFCDLAADATIAAGTYNFKDCELYYFNTVAAAASYKLNFSTVTVFTNMPDKIGVHIKFNNASGYVFNPTASFSIIEFTSFGKMESAGSLAAINVASGKVIIFFVSDAYGGDFTNGGITLVNIATGGTFQIINSANGSLVNATNDIVSGSGTFQIISANGVRYSGTNGSFSGSFFEQLGQFATNAPAWNSTTSYGIGEIVRDGSSPYNFYISRINSNTNNLTSDTTKWIALAGGGGSGTNYGNVVIYKPAIGSSTGNAFKTWAEVMAAIAALSYEYIELIFDTPGFFGTVSIAAGTYDLSRCRISPAVGTLLPIISFADGTTLSGFPAELNAVTIECLNTSTPLFTLAAPIGICQVQGGAIRTGAGSTQPVIKVNNGCTFIYLSQSNGTLLYKSGGQEVVESNGTFTLTVYQAPNSLGFFNTNNIFKGTGTITLELYDSGNVYTATNSGFSGTFNNYEYGRNRIKDIVAQNNYTVIFDPTTSFGNTYNTLDKAILALQDLQTRLGNGTKTILVNAATPDTVISIPSSVYNLFNIIIGATWTTVRPVLDFADGTNCELPLKIQDGVIFRFNNTVAPVKTLITTLKPVIIEDGKIINLGTQPVLSLNTDLTIVMENTSTFVPTGYEIFDILPGRTLNIIAKDYAKLNVNNVYRNNGSVNIKDYTLRASTDNGYGTHTNFGGSLVTTPYYENRVTELAKASTRFAIFDPAGGDHDGHFFNTLAKALTYLQASAATRKILFVTAPFAGTISIAAAAYNFNGVEIINTMSIYSTPLILNFADGTTITTNSWPAYVGRDITLKFNNTSSYVCLLNTGLPGKLHIMEDSAIENAGTQEVIRLQGGGAAARFEIANYSNPGLLNFVPTSYELFQSGPGSGPNYLIINLKGSAKINANDVFRSNTAGFTVQVNDYRLTEAANAGVGTHANIIGSVTVTSYTEPRVNELIAAFTANKFTSADQTITSGGTLTLPHGLGAAPFLIQAYLVCQTGEYGYTAGDVVVANIATSNSAADGYGASISTNGVINIDITFGSQTTVFLGTNKTTGGDVGFTNANWKLRIVALK